ncbi:recombinase family protein [Gorillibacterium sp. sgz5001074]|uniref:recombinase family protein n=1 Tax=Gorillibacterium sp. sgz5001074 TaxID=3446695 RepID=UPI003F667982
MRAALYIRVSTDEQAEEGFSIEGQKNRLRSFCDSQDWMISKVYIDDGYSAKDLNRPQMQQLIKDIPNDEFDIILIYKLNRLTRSAADCDYLLKLFDRYNIKFQSCTESYETRTATGRLFIRLMADIAQWERENIAENVRFGMEQMVKEGQRPGGPVPFGYDKDGKIIPEEAAVLHELRQLYMSGNGFKTVASILNNRGLLRRGFSWTAQTVYYVLDNPYYAGKIRWGTKKMNGKYASRKKEEKVNCIFSDGSHEPIFAMEAYEEHTRRMKVRSFGGYTKAREYWFAGILRCAKCGSAMTGRYHQNKRKDGSFNKILSYICSKRQMSNGCDMPMFRQELVERLVLDYVDQIKLNLSKVDEMEQEAKQERHKVESELDELRKQLSEVQKRKKKWQYAFANDLMSEDDLRERSNEEKLVEDSLAERIKALQNQTGDLREEVMDTLFDMRDIWDVLDDKEKNEFVTTLFQTIELDTPIGKAHGRKGQFIPASIKSIEYV